MGKTFKKDKETDCLVSVHGTDFHIPENGQSFNSFKFLKSGLRYKVCLCILTGDIVWINGLYAPVEFNDLQIFRMALKSYLLPGERVEADDGYVGEAPRYIKCPKSIANPKKNKKRNRGRSRHETVNKRFKNWGALKQVYRHDVLSHGEVFCMVAVITQLTINSGEKLFSSSDYEDNH